MSGTPGWLATGSAHASSAELLHRLQKNRGRLATSKERFCTEVQKSRIFLKTLTCCTSSHTCEIYGRYARSNYPALSVFLILRPAYLLSIAFVNLLKQKKKTYEKNKNYGWCTMDIACPLLKHAFDLICTGMKIGL